MYEILPIASALRLPIIMSDVNRALSGPINIHCDHSDTMAARDFGWIQIFSEDAQAKQFVGERKAEVSLLDVEHPVTLGALDLPDYYFEHKLQVAEAMRQASQHILEIAKEFEQQTGRKYDLIENYKLDDAEIAIVALGSTAGTTKAVVDEL